MRNLCNSCIVNEDKTKDVEVQETPNIILACLFASLILPAFLTSFIYELWLIEINVYL